jgi:hypothetical protein
MVLVGHSQRLAEPLTRRERRTMAAFGVLLVAAVIAVAVLVTTGNGGGSVSRNGCVSILVAGSTGVELLHECGAPARSWCKSELGRRSTFALKLAVQCRLAGIDPTLRGAASGAH